MNSKPTTVDGDPGSAAARYWVVGGIYTDTDFQHFALGFDAERHGPFDTYKAALADWGRLSWRQVGDCHAHYRIETEEPATAEA